MRWPLVGHQKSGTTWGPLRIVKEGRDRKFRPFQKPHELQVAKYLNLNARESQFRVIEKQLFLARFHGRGSLAH